MDQPEETIINLEDGTMARPSVVIRFRGGLVALSRERLVELLLREEAYLAEKLGGTPRPLPSLSHAVAAPAKALAEPSLPPPSGAVNHAGLSMRIKRIFNYSAPSGRMRKTHSAFLSDLLDQFDWQIPEHPNTKLDFHLKEIAGWPGTDPELVAKISAFLERYTQERFRRTA